MQEKHRKKTQAEIEYNRVKGLVSRIINKEENDLNAEHLLSKQAQQIREQQKTLEKRREYNEYRDIKPVGVFEITPNEKMILKLEQRLRWSEIILRKEQANLKAGRGNYDSEGGENKWE